MYVRILHVGYYGLSLIQFLVLLLLFFMLLLLANNTGSLLKCKENLENACDQLVAKINKKIKASGEMSGNGTWNAMKTRWEDCVSNIMQGDSDTQGLDPFRRELSMFLQEAALLGAEDEVPDELLKKSQEYSDTGCEHIKESKELIKSMRAQQLD